MDKEIIIKGRVAPNGDGVEEFSIQASYGDFCYSLFIEDGKLMFSAEYYGPSGMPDTYYHDYTLYMDFRKHKGLGDQSMVIAMDAKGNQEYLYED